MTRRHEPREKLLPAGQQLTVSLGAYQDGVDAALAEIKQQQIVARIWAHDYTVWKPEPTEITNRLGWLHTAEVMAENLDRLESLAEAVCADSPRDAPIPNENEAGWPDSSISFGVLEMAQALGDRQALLDAGRRVIRFHLGDDVAGGVKTTDEDDREVSLSREYVVKRFILAFLLLILSSACGMEGTAQPPLPSPEPTTATSQIVRGIGWRKVRGVVYAEVAAPGHELAGVRVECFRFDSSYPHNGICAPSNQITTGPNGIFEFDVFVHGRDQITLSAQKPGYGLTERQISGSDCVEDCLPVNLVLIESTVNAWNVELVGHIGGGSRAIFVQRNYAYTGFGPELAVLDISDPTYPTRVGYVVLPGLVQAIYVSGHYAYVAAGYAGLRVVDVSDPTAPVEVGFYDTRGYASGVAVTDNYAYVTDTAWSASGLHIVDVSDPAAPVETGFHEMWGGPAQDIVVAGNYAYVANGKNGLNIVNVSNPAQPVRVGSFYSVGESVGVDVVGDYAYVAKASSHYIGRPYRGLQVVDVSDPTAPVEVGFHDTRSNVSDLSVMSGYAYITAGNLRVVNVSTPATPIEVGSLSMGGGSVAVSDDYAYVASDSLRVVNLSDPTAPVEIGSYNTLGWASGVAAGGGYAYVVEGVSIHDSGVLRIVNVLDPTAPVVVGSCSMPRKAEDVAIAGDYAYVTDYGGGLRVIDISDATAPTEVGFYAIPHGGRDVVVAGNYAYVVEMSVWRGRQGYEGGDLWVVDVSDPTTPVEVGVYDVPVKALAVMVVDSYAYVATGDAGLRVVDVSVPTDPIEVSFWGISQETRAMRDAEDVVVADDRAYVTVGHNGLWVVDVSNPTAPIEVGAYGPPGGAYAVAVADGYAYIVESGGQFGGLRVVDISAPPALTGGGFYDTPGWASGVVVANGYIYVADGDGGLFILHFTPLTERE